MKHKTQTRTVKEVEWSISWRWERYDAKRTKEQGGDPSLAIDNYVSWSAKGGCNYHKILQEIATAAWRPFPVDSLSPFISERTTSRGLVIFDYVGTAIDKIVRQYPGLRWWLSKEGLVVAAIPPVTKPLSEFDLLAGRSMANCCADGKLSKEDLRDIAATLDTVGFSLKDHLQPSQWKPIAEFNQKYSKLAIKTFENAAGKPQFSRFIRRRLYVAHSRYRDARPEVHHSQSTWDVSPLIDPVVDWIRHD